MKFKKYIIVFIIGSILFGAGGLYYYKKNQKKVPVSETIYKISTDNENNIYAHAKNIIFVDFEDFELGGSIVSEIAYSGEKSCLIEGKNSFSPVIKRKIGAMGWEHFSRIGISANIYAFPHNFSELNVQLVAAITDEAGKNLFWGNVSVKSIFFTPEKWIKVSGAFDLDINSFTENDYLNVYLWNDSKTKVLMDDLLIVAGKDDTPIGDSVYCFAQINGQGLPPFNFPPFDIEYLQKEKVAGLEYLLKVQKQSHLKSLSQLAIVGNFYNTHNQLDKIVFKSDEKLRTLSYNESRKKFEQYNIEASLSLLKMWDKGQKLTANFSHPLKEDLIIWHPEFDTLLFVQFENKNISNKSINNIIAITKPFPLSSFYHDNLKPHYIYPLLINGRAEASLLVLYETGDWVLFDWDQVSWAKYLIGTERFFSSTINQDIPHIKIINGKFLNPQLNNLIVFDNQNKVFELKSLNSSKKQFENAQSKSVYIGLNAFKINDSYFVIKTKGKKDKVLRYAEGAYFDLKLGYFNDTTFIIDKTIDFTGYDKDFNPKYYEITNLLTGNFISSNYTSLITICTNCNDIDFNGTSCLEYKNSPLLPNAVHIFSFK